MDSEQIVYVEPDDDLDTIWGRLEFCPATNIVMVIPRGNRHLRSAITMKLLWRQVRGLSEIPVIVTPDSTIRSLARQQGFDTFSSLRRYYKSLPLSAAVQTRQPAPVPDWARETAYTRFVAPWLRGTLALALVALLALACVPSASVNLVPAGRVYSTPINVTADSVASKADSAQHIIPAQPLEATVEGSLEAPTTGRRLVSDSIPRGSVTFTNRGDVALEVPKGTVVVGATQRARFVTLGSVYLPARGVRAAAVQAEGAEGLVARRGEVTTIDGPLAERITVTNDEPISGGQETEVSFVTPLDRSRLEETLKRDLSAKGQARVRQLADKGSSVIFMPGEPTVSELRFDKEIDEQAQLLSLFIRLTVKGVGFRGEDLNQVTRDTLVQQAGTVIPNGRLRPETIKVNPPEVVRVAAGAATLRLQASAVVEAPVDLGGLKRQLLGRSLDEARQILAGQANVAESRIATAPSWVKRMPFLPFRIELSVAAPKA